MESQHGSDKEHAEKTNTEYVPTKCRITKPPPPKPATNPLQFIKVAPCPLYRKAQEQLKKVEEIKSTRQHVREEAEDWQKNLDNWKSSRRKQQEHIIERVVEVKKLEQEEHERTRRKSKTFSEMIEERTKGRHKFNIPIYDDDSNDLSDYGIQNTSSKTNSFKNVDTDDDNSLSNEKRPSLSDSTSNKYTNISSIQSQSEDETRAKNSHSLTNRPKNDLKSSPPKSEVFSRNSTSNLLSFTTGSLNTETTIKSNDYTKKNIIDRNELDSGAQEYTYEGAIENYRSRIKSKINVDESVFNKVNDKFRKENTESQNTVPKGQIFKCKEMFELEKPLEINHYESSSTRRQLEEFANSQSVKERLQNFQKCAEQNTKNSTDKIKPQIGSVKSKLQNFSSSEDTKNNNYTSNALKPLKSSKSISDYLMNESEYADKNDRNQQEATYRSSSPEAELYMNKLNMFSNDLDNLMFSRRPHSSENELDDSGSNLNYPPSTSSTEMLGTNSDREDSGIHTADVSCSVSQADEPVEYSDISAMTIPHCIEKLTIEKHQTIHPTTERVGGNSDSPMNMAHTDSDADEKSLDKIYYNEEMFKKENLIQVTEDFLNAARHDSSQNLSNVGKPNQKPPLVSKPAKPVIYENVEIKPFPMECVMDDSFKNSDFPLAPPKVIEPPKAKPPPPPLDLGEEPKTEWADSTSRLKKEIHLKRSSFLGLGETGFEKTEPELTIISKPPDINSFLQSESKLEKSLYKKIQEDRECGLSKVESQDSGLDIERGRLSSDTWCSSIGDSSTISPGQEDSEPANSISSEDEITKKEREIIEMVEKEEKSRDNTEFSNYYSYSPNAHVPSKTPPANPYFTKMVSQPYHGHFEDADPEGLKVKHELLQLEKEQQERQRMNVLFNECRLKTQMQPNRHSLENICDSLDTGNNMNYRKSMPELQCISKEYRKSGLDTQNASKRKDLSSLQYRKSMPNIQHAYYKSTTEYQNSASENTLGMFVNNRKSMPELESNCQKSAFCSPSVLNRQPILSGKPISLLTKEQKQRSSSSELIDFPQYSNGKQSHHSPRRSLPLLNAPPKLVPSDNWIQPRVNPELKNYNQHWLCQEAELRRISDQRAATSRNRQQARKEKHLPDSIIQTLTQRLQNKTKPDSSPTKEYVQHTYFGPHSQTLGHALPLSYPPVLNTDDSHNRILSVSGKKKCSYCGNELGRGAAMIIESLCLFYHMECFKCCVCHVQLGDGLMGTDVRVRNQKLHCHNCYSSDDGVKFSCV